MTVIMDYGYNTNEVEINCLALRQGSWNYNELDIEDRTIYSEDDKGNKTSYYYDENNRLVNAVVTDKMYCEHTNCYEYNKQMKYAKLK